MGLEEDIGTKFDEELLLLKNVPKEQFDPQAKIGLRPLYWAIDTELKSARQVTTEIRKFALRKQFQNDFQRENFELKLFGKCYLPNQ